ncbi:MAG: hypothetical protein FJ210_07660, partial [Betaproteobacteria bacterium]|nr:hypothetical protein [Betaproteobacteria bacterium]
MPYYLYKIGTLNILTKMGENADFKAARVEANEMRKSLAPGEKIKIMFAANELAAEELLSTPRDLDHTLAGDDY